MRLSKLRLRVGASRLEHEGYVKSDWQQTENNRRARYYRITASGRRALGMDVAAWERFVVAIQAVLAS